MFIYLQRGDKCYIRDMRGTFYRRIRRIQVRLAAVASMIPSDTQMFDYKKTVIEEKKMTVFL